MANPTEKERCSPIAKFLELWTIMSSFHVKSWDQRDWIDKMRASKSRGRAPSIFWKQKRESIDVWGVISNPALTEVFLLGY